jgi:hypothetical protein
VLSHHADTIGYALASRRAGSRLLANDARPVGVLRVPTRLEEGAAEAIRERFEHAQRRDNYGRVAVIGAGAEYQNIGLPPDELQFVEQMEWGLLDVARVFLVPPHKIGYLKDAGDRANIEHENLRFATDCLAPAARRLELAIDRKALTLAEQAQGVFTKIDLRALLRGDFKSRMEGYAIARQNGLKNANEIRALEDEPPIEGRAGEVYLVPANLLDASVATGEPEAEDPADAPPEDDPERGLAERLVALEPVFCDAAARLEAREEQELPAVAAIVSREGWSRRADERLAAAIASGASRLEALFAPVLAAAGLAPDAAYWAARAEAYRAEWEMLVAGSRAATAPAEAAEMLLELGERRRRIATNEVEAALDWARGMR